MVKLEQCAVKGCEIKHKSSTGYCVEHAHLIDRQYVSERRSRRGLAEEYRFDVPREHYLLKDVLK